MSVRNRTAGALLATIVAGAVTVAVTQSGGTANAANASVAQSTSASVGRAQPVGDVALEDVLGLTRTAGGQTYRAAGTYSAGNALTSLGAR
jgi:hypothetical protein